MCMWPKLTASTWPGQNVTLDLSECREQALTKHGPSLLRCWAAVQTSSLQASSLSNGFLINFLGNWNSLLHQELRVRNVLRQDCTKLILFFFPCIMRE